MILLRSSDFEAGQSLLRAFGKIIWSIDTYAALSPTPGVRPRINDANNRQWIVHSGYLYIACYVRLKVNSVAPNVQMFTC